MKYLTSLFFLLVIFGIGISSSINYVFNTSKSYELINTTIKDTNWINLENKPTPEKLDESSIIKSCIRYAEKAININLFHKQAFIEYYGLVQKYLCRNVVEDASDENDVYKLKDGTLALGPKVRNIGVKDSQKIFFEDRIIALKTFDKFVYETIGNHLYYISTPIKIKNFNNPYFPNCEEDFMEYLNIIKNSTFINFYNLDEDTTYLGPKKFYYTDHHWRVEYAFTRMSDICKFLEINDSCFKYNKWKLTNSGRIFNGSLANRVGDHFINERDTFKYYEPLFDTQIKVSYYSYPNQIKIREGKLQETVMFPEILKWDNKYANLYAFCNQGDNPLVQIQNYKSFIDEKILIIGDSFSAPIVTYLSIVFREMTVLDLRSYKERNLQEMIKKNKYDKVILIYNFASSKMFKFD